VCVPACGGGGDDERGSAPVEPILSLDTVRVIESERLWRVRTARPGPDGSTVVLNGGSVEVFVFDSAGRLAQVFGGEGQGPGEFGSPRDIHVRGDSIYVIDTSPFTRRLSLFVGGALARDWPLGHIPGTFVRIAVRGDGTPIVAGQRDAMAAGIPAAPVFFRDSIAMVALPETADAPAEVLLTLPGVENMVRPVAEGYTRSLPSFRTDLSYAMTRSGVVGVDHRTGGVVRWTWTGDSVIVRPPPAERPLVSAAELAQWEEAVEGLAQRVQLPDQTPFSSQAGIDRWGGSIPRPIFEDLLSDGTLTAVQRYEFGPTHPTDWLVLDAAGDSVGGWQLPAHIRLLALEGDRVLALARDSLDVESIIVFGIVERATARGR
jgi:hypothetical protein